MRFLNQLDFNKPNTNIYNYILIKDNLINKKHFLFISILKLSI